LAYRRRFGACGAVNVANTNIANYQFSIYLIPLEIEFGNWQNLHIGNIQHLLYTLPPKLKLSHKLYHTATLSFKASKKKKTRGGKCRPRAVVSPKRRTLTCTGCSSA
jgi:hypothetical protein